MAQVKKDEVRDRIVDAAESLFVERGYTDARYHAVSHPRGSEAEAFHRLIAFSELIDQPVIIYHVATAEGAAVIREARGRGVKVFAETCTQYLFLTKQDLVRAPGEGAKWVCSPPLREEADQEALWQALALGDLQIVTSDHAPYTLDENGKKLKKEKEKVSFQITLAEVEDDSSEEESSSEE